MTVYNGEPHLLSSVESILNQSFSNFEFIIVDDASTDNSLKILQAAANRDSRIRLLTQEKNVGQTASLNLGIREARGRWIARMDADDISLPDRLERLVNTIKKNPDSLQVIGSQGWIMDESSRMTGTINVPLTDAGIRASLALQNPFIHAAVMFRRELPNGKLAQYDTNYRICQDWEMWGRLLEYGQGLNLSDRLLAYRHHESSLSHAQTEKTAAEADQISRHFLAGQSHEKEAATLFADFRKGTLWEERHYFWKIWRKVNDDADATALHHLTLAGAAKAAGKSAWWQEVLAAVRASPKRAFCFLVDIARKGLVSLNFMQRSVGSDRSDRSTG